MTKNKMKTLNEKKQQIKEQDVDTATRQLTYALKNNGIEGVKREGRGILKIHTDGGSEPVVVEVKGFKMESDETEEEEDGTSEQKVDESPHPQGGFSDEVWETKFVQSYTEPYGYIGTTERVRSSNMDEMDKQLENYLREQGLSVEEIGAFLVSKSGRIVAESGLDPDVMEQSVRQFLTHVEEYGLDDFM